MVYQVHWQGAGLPGELESGLPSSLAGAGLPGGVKHVNVDNLTSASANSDASSFILSLVINKFPYGLPFIES